MRRTILTSILVVWCVLAWGRKAPPQTPFTSAAWTPLPGLGLRETTPWGSITFGAPPDSTYGPAEIALGYYYETGNFLTRDPAQALTLHPQGRSTRRPACRLARRPALFPRWSFA